MSFFSYDMVMWFKNFCCWFYITNFFFVLRYNIPTNDKLVPNKFYRSKVFRFFYWFFIWSKIRRNKFFNFKNKNKNRFHLLKLFFVWSRVSLSIININVLQFKSTNFILSFASAVSTAGLFSYQRTAYTCLIIHLNTLCVCILFVATLI